MFKAFFVSILIHGHEFLKMMYELQLQVSRIIFYTKNN